MHQEGVPTIAIPKTMDNDVHGTDYCIGFSTAITRGVQFIHNLRTSTGSHERIAVVELFGRYSGETSLITAYLAGVDRALISEVPFDIDRLSELLVADKGRNPSKYAMCTISEGATIEGGDMMLSGDADAYGHRKLGGIGQLTGELIKERTGQDIVYQQVGYLMRSGSPDSLELRRDGRRLGPRRVNRSDGGAAQRHLLLGADLGHRRRRQAGGHRRALRPAELPPQGSTRAWEAHVLVLIGVA
jgi:6-phosphofructokinase 1